MNLSCRIIISLILVLFRTTILSQNYQDSVPLQNCIKIYPLNYASSNEINLAYERVISKVSSVEIIVAYNYKDIVYFEPGSNRGLQIGAIPFNYLERGSPKSHYSQGGSVRLEYRRYYDKRRKAPVGRYISPQLMYKIGSMKNIRYSGEYYSEYYDLLQQSLTAKLLFGVQTRIRSIAIDYYCGFGLRFKNQITTRHRYTIETVDYERIWVNDNNHTKFSYNYFYPTLHFGVSLGVMF